MLRVKQKKFNGKPYTLLPIGNINKRVQYQIEKRAHNRGTDSLSGAENTELYHISGDINQMINNIEYTSQKHNSDLPKAL